MDEELLSKSSEFTERGASHTEEGIPTASTLVKAPSVIVVTDGGGVRFSARNSLAGTVARVQAGAVNAEVVIDVPGGVSVAAIVTQDSANRLGLAVGKPATAIFKASSVIVGVPA